MVLSNMVKFTVYSPETRPSPELKIVGTPRLVSDKNEYVVGETAKFTIDVTLNRVPSPQEIRQYCFEFDVIVNNKKVRTLRADMVAGRLKQTITFQLPLVDAGEYLVVCDVRIAMK